MGLQKEDPLQKEDKFKKYEYEAIAESKSYGLGVRHLQISLISLAVLVLFIVRTSMGVAILAMIDKTSVNTTSVTIYDWDEKTQGLIKSSFFWGYFVMQVPGGIMAKKFGGKPLVFSALLLNGLLSLTLPFMAKYWNWQAVCLTRIAMGLTQACLVPSCHTLLGKWIPPHERSRLSNIAYCGTYLGTIVSMPLCGILAKTSFGWPAIYYMTGALSLLMGILWMGLSANSPRQHQMITDEEMLFIENSLNTPDAKLALPIPWKSIFTSVPLFAVIIAQSGFVWIYLILINELPNYFKNCFKMSVEESANISTLPFISMWLMSIVFGFLSEEIYNRKIVTVTFSRKLFNSIAYFGTAAGFIWLIFMTKEQETLATIILTISSALLSSCGSGVMLSHIDLSPNFAGVLFSIGNCIANSFGLMEPITSGLLLHNKPDDFSRWQYVFIIGASIAIVSNMIFISLDTAQRQPWDDPEFQNKNKKAPDTENATDKEDNLSVY